MKKTIYDITTGESTIVDFTKEELAELKNNKEQADLLLAAQVEAEAAKLAAQAKLVALGLTQDDLKALGLN